jgi:hypothetical protein
MCLPESRDMRSSRRRGRNRVRTKCGIRCLPKARPQCHCWMNMRITGKTAAARITESVLSRRLSLAFPGFLPSRQPRVSKICRYRFTRGFGGGLEKILITLHCPRLLRSHEH